MHGETNLSGFFQPERLIPNIHCHAALARGPLNPGIPTFIYHFTALVTTFGAQLDDPVSGTDDVQIVLHNQYAISVVDQLIKYSNQLYNILHVQSGRGFIEDIQARSPAGARMFRVPLIQQFANQ